MPSKKSLRQNPVSNKRRTHNGQIVEDVRAVTYAYAVKPAEVWKRCTQCRSANKDSGDNFDSQGLCGRCRRGLAPRREAE